jgi:putative DNA primase/helicase
VGRVARRGTRREEDQVPYRANGAGRASSTDPATWSTFEQAVTGAEALSADGIGYVFSPDDPYVGVDLDDGLSEADRGAIMCALDSYTEMSVSGTGVHIIVRASLNGYGRNRKGPVEVYETSRFFCMTGQHVRGTPTTIEARQAELGQVLEKYLPPQERPVSTPAAPQPVSLSNRRLLDRMFASMHGPAIRQLWNGDTSAHGGDDFAADLALLNHLAYWTNKDAARMETLFGQSALGRREKWKARPDYRERTIREAIAGTPNGYEPRPAARKERVGAEPDTVSERTDLGNAERFAAEHAGRLRHVKERRAWLAYGGGRWRLDTTGEAERAAKATVKAMLREAVEIADDDHRAKAVKYALASQSAPKIAAMVSLASTEEGIAIEADALDRDRMLLAVGNGTLDLKTGRLRAPDPADLISLGTDVRFDPDASCPRWERFLDEVFQDDRELTGWLQRFLGYCLTGSTVEQKVAVFYGLGGNGKDTLLKPVQRILGDHALTCPFDTFTRARGDRGARNDLARLHRARLVVASESDEGKRLDEALVKLVAGGGKVAARFLYGEFFEFDPQFKVVLVTNNKPKVDGDDEAIWRRLRLVPFNVTFEGREDRTLDAQFEAGLPGILNWALEGCLTWQRDGLGSCAAVEQATTEYRQGEDVLGAFLAERCTLGAEETCEPNTLRAAFADYCESVGEKPVAATVLGKKLARRRIRKATRHSQTVYLGVSLP